MPGTTDTADTKAIVLAFAQRMDARDWAGFGELLHPDVTYELPQTRERIRGRDRYVRFNAEYPGDWHVTPQLVLAEGRDASLLFRWRSGHEDLLAIAYFEVDGGLVTKVTDYWPEPYEPPPGREHLVERW